LRCGGIFSDLISVIANFLLILTVKGFWKSVNIWWTWGIQKMVPFFGPPCRLRCCRCRTNLQRCDLL